MTTTRRINYFDRMLLTGIGFLAFVYLESVTIEWLIAGPLTKRYWRKIEGKR